MTQPEALRLAERLEDTESARLHLMPYAAAELRRLHEANEAFGKRQEWWNEKMFALEQQRDALLEALQDLCDTLGECGMTERARGTIEAVEGENHAKSL